MNTDLRAEPGRERRNPGLLGTAGLQALPFQRFNAADRLADAGLALLTQGSRYTQRCYLGNTHCIYIRTQPPFARLLRTVSLHPCPWFVSGPVLLCDGPAGAARTPCTQGGFVAPRRPHKSPPETRGSCSHVPAVPFPAGRFVRLKLTREVGCTYRSAGQGAA